jgi:hypothetical protein
VGCHNNQKYGEKLLSLIEQYGDEETPCLVVFVGGCDTINNNIAGLIGNTWDSLEVLDTPTHEHGRVVFRAPGDGVLYFGVNVEDLDHLYKDLEGLTDNQKAHKIQFFIFNSIKKLQFDNVNHYYFRNDDNQLEVYSEDSGSVKDLEAMGAKIQDYSVKALEEKLAINYGLSNDRAEKVAKSIYSYNKLSSKRSLTKREKDFYADELLGASYQEVTDSFTAGENMESLLEKAADKNGTSPEQVSAIITELFM